jgi:predicted Ser/Thr protein kinase
MRTVVPIISQPVERVRELFEAASAEEGAAREALLSRECDGDDELRALVERMIEADAQPHAILDKPLAADSRVFEGPVFEAGSMVGPYRIIRGIASGGMGAVYLARLAAETTDSVVALKIMRGFSLEFSRRFQRERHILTRLQHPNIARLLDAGTTAEDHPYFAMEFVEGAPLDVWCDRNQMSARDRVRLFRQVCAAVHYLHQNLVVHRDLKPGNILVTSGGNVKLLDFGIAKLLSGSETTPADATTALMTPGYASPEQVRGLPTSTLTDVWGLGVLLYELLTGARPFEAPRGELHEALRRICEEEPRPPAVDGELDNIVLKAIRKEPERRYASVEQFDEDLRRYLDGLPVLAQGDSVAYRARKFAGRHRAGIAVAAAMVLLLSGGILATAFEANVARRERALAETHAQAAEAARALAQDQRMRADAQAAEAQRERENAERRLAELQKVAQGAVGIYASLTGPGGKQDPAALIAETARDSLAILQSEGIRESRAAALSDQLSNDARSDALALDPAWHVPARWKAQESVAGEYQVGIDGKIAHQGKSSLFLRSRAAHPTGRVEVYQEFDARRYRGKRVRVAGYFRAARIEGQATLNLTAIGSGDRTEVPGTPQWKRSLVVIDVPDEAEVMRLGVQLNGTGTLWVDDLNFEQVPATVPLTIRVRPENLNFTDLR